MGACERSLFGFYNALAFRDKEHYSSLFIGMFFSLVTSESQTMSKAALFASLIGFLGCDLIVSGLMGFPFSYTLKSRCGPVESPLEPT